MLFSTSPLITEMPVLLKGKYRLSLFKAMRFRDLVFSQQNSRGRKQTREYNVWFGKETYDFVRILTCESLQSLPSRTSIFMIRYWITFFLKLFAILRDELQRKVRAFWKPSCPY